MPGGQGFAESLRSEPKGLVLDGQFLRHYKAWLGEPEVTMRQQHKAGEKMFVDNFAGQTMDVVDPVKPLPIRKRFAAIFIGAAWRTTGNRARLHPGLAAVAAGVDLEKSSK